MFFDTSINFERNGWRVYRNPLCYAIDNYNSRAFYEPSYAQIAALKDGEKSYFRKLY